MNATPGGCRTGRGALQARFQHPPRANPRPAHRPIGGFADDAGLGEARAPQVGPRRAPEILPYGRVVVSVYEPLPLYEYASQR